MSQFTECEQKLLKIFKTLASLCIYCKHWHMSCIHRAWPHTILEKFFLKEIKRIPSGIVRRYFTLIASSKVHVDAHKVETVPLITLKTEITLNPYL